MARIHGKKGQILMDETGGSPYTPTALGDVNAFTLNLATDRVEVTAFQDTNKQRVAGLPDFAGTFGGFWNSANSPRIFSVVLGGLPAYLQLFPNSLEATYYFHGLANIDASLDVSATGAVSFSGNWDAASNWQMEP